MKQAPPPTNPPAPHPRTAAARAFRVRSIPAFVPVPVRARADGWTGARQAAFIGGLAETRCVATAAARTGMSREGAYRLQRHEGAEGFRLAWDAALGDIEAAGALRRKVTLEEAFSRVRTGVWRPVMRAGRFSHAVHEADKSALFRALSHIDRVAEGRLRAGNPLRGSGA